MNPRLMSKEPDDQVCRDHLAPLRQLRPPQETQAAVRDAVVRELAQLQSATRRIDVPFWRRTVAIPWPIVAAALVAVIAMPLLLWRSHAVSDQLSHELAIAVQAGQPKAGKEKQVRKEGDKSRPTLAHYESETYLCGVGPLHSTSQYVFQEQ